jgi:hypothetical protein
VDTENVTFEIGTRQEPSKTRTGRPWFAGTQEKTILDLLIKAKSRGVSKKFLIFELGFTQCGARINSLERRGHKIRHEMRPGDRYTTFVLESSPERETPLPTYEKKRPSGDNSDLPLFAGVR